METLAGDLETWNNGLTIVLFAIVELSICETSFMLWSCEPLL